MVDNQSDEALHRLQASDPATGSHPDLHRVRELIAHKAPASQRSDAATVIDDDLLRGPRIREPWVAAAAAAAIGIGAGGYALGAQGDGDGDTIILADQNNPLTPAGAGIDVGTSADMSESAGVVSEGSGDTSSAQIYDPGPVRLAAGEGLSTERTTAEIRTLVSDEDPQEALDRWTEAMGFEGTPVPEGEEFFGSGAGEFDLENGRWAMVSADSGALSLNYNDMFRSEYCAESFTSTNPEEMALLTEEWQKMFGPDVPMPTAEDCIEPTGPRPTDAEALAMATEFFRAAGVPVDDYTVRVADYTSGPESTSVMVEAFPEGGFQGQLQANATVGPDGVVDGYATTGEMTSLGDYPVISPVEAVERYGQREFTMDYGVMTEEDFEAASDSSMVEYVEPDLPEPPTVEPGMKLPLLLKDKVVTGAELVRGSLWTQAGSFEVPVWRLTTDDGMHYTVMAVADEAIDWQSWE